MQNGHVACRRHAEDRAFAFRPAPNGSSIKVAVGRLNEGAVGKRPVRAVAEVMKYRHNTAGVILNAVSTKAQIDGRAMRKLSSVAWTSTLGYGIIRKTVEASNGYCRPQR